MSDAPETSARYASSDAQAVDASIELLRAEIASAREALKAADRRHHADLEREAMLRSELQHRVRNMLALVRSIFDRTIGREVAVEELAAHFQGRIDTLARYQLTRTAEPGGTADLETMVRDELHNFRAGGDPRVEVGGPEVRLPYDVAQLVGLALHELATNAIKFGALATSDGRMGLSVTWRLGNGVLTMRWEESGVPILFASPVESGFGHSLIEKALPYQLGATTGIEFRPGGVLCTMAIPLSGHMISGRLGGGL